MGRLLDQFSALFSFGLAIDASNPAGSGFRTRDAAQEDALALLDAARLAATASGTPPQQLESATFAMVAWLDEIFARQPQWHDECPPLQAQLFNSANAHSEFFHHLSALQADDDAVREVYWHALAHGFVGQYYFEKDDSGELGKLKDLHGRQLRSPPLSLATLAQEHLTPQPYASADPAGPRDPLRRERTLLRAGGALALLLPLAFLLSLMLAGPRPAPPTFAQQLRMQLDRYACADLRADTGNDDTLRVTGFVPLQDDVARVAREVRALPGVQSATFDLGLRVWPHCEVVDILKPYQTRNREKALGLRVGAPSARSGRLREGDAVRISLTGANYDGHVQVDYYTADGAVQHLNRGVARAQVAAGQRTEFGQDIPSSWLVSPPFGTVLVSVLSSPAPFTELGDRPPFELASAYLLTLREALSANKGGERLIAELLFLETAERP
ncbi:type IV / vi secretion system, dotu [Variovorax sp. PAMC 28711]|nr:type IV / vi secretion system, dotu [Variovorax sp. PAMC 28711]